MRPIGYRYTTPDGAWLNLCRMCTLLAIRADFAAVLPPVDPEAATLTVEHLLEWLETTAPEADDRFGEIYPHTANHGEDQALICARCPTAIWSPPINVALLSNIANLIRTRPDLHDNQFWAARVKTGTASYTTYCVGGWAIVLSGGRFDWRRARCAVSHARRWHALTSSVVRPETLPDSERISLAAQRLLRVNTATARRLFNPAASSTDVLSIIEDILAAPAGAAGAP
ncbi:hypothetical protein [Catenulispora pinisilvae]|uniref:hypothetical protein n=1 Tax=Catenulispora pinisilvae TaxID=2705253 RepID=UPI001892770D|nr:hypothetical protein [Catenulispora pinisilvae]